MQAESASLKPRQKSDNLSTGTSLLNDKYLLSQLIGKGSFGQVYRGVYTDKSKQQLIKYPKYTAIKVENDTSKISQMPNQIAILTALHKGKHQPGFPRLYASGIENGRPFMITDLLGPNLQDLMHLCGGKFSLKTSLLLIIQIIQRIETIHQMGFVYRDIKPQNFLMGVGISSKEVYMVDFGLCKRYRDINTKLMVPYKEATSMVGTIRYSSLNSHLGIDQTRRDDLQSICNLLVYFIKGELPWQGLGFQHKFQKDHMIMSRKLKITPQQLCQGLPSQIQNIIQYVKKLDFYEDPDYHYILSQLSFVVEDECDSSDLSYDWQMFEKEERYQKQHLELIFPSNNPLDPLEYPILEQSDQFITEIVTLEPKIGSRYSNFKV